jgi:hypothetical protein
MYTTVAIAFSLLSSGRGLPTFRKNVL